MVVPLWTRTDRRATGRVADVVMIAFHEGALAEGVPMSRARYGAPDGDAIGKVDVMAIEDPSWIQGFRAGAIRNVATTQLSAAELRQLDAARACVTVRATIADPADLGHLQASWAIVRWLVERGASVVLDAHPIHFHGAERIRAHDVLAPIDASREIAVIFETEPDVARLAHVVHTRGMIKVARPDLIALVDPKQAEAMGRRLRALAVKMIDGLQPRAGEIVDGVRFEGFDGDTPSLAESLNLNNDALLVELTA